MRAKCYAATVVALAVATCLPAPSHALGAGAATSAPLVLAMHGGLKLKALRGGATGVGAAAKYPFETDMVSNNLRKMWVQPAVYGEENG